MLVENMEVIKVRIREMISQLRALMEENDQLKAQVVDKTNIVEQKESEIIEYKKRDGELSILEQENQQLKTERSMLSGSIDEMIKDLESL